MCIMQCNPSTTNCNEWFQIFLISVFCCYKCSKCCTEQVLQRAFLLSPAFRFPHQHGLSCPDSFQARQKPRQRSGHCISHPLPQIHTKGKFVCFVQFSGSMCTKCGSCVLKWQEKQYIFQNGTKKELILVIESTVNTVHNDVGLTFSGGLDAYAQM